jgi:AcrR family transcriptional regulator
MAILPSSKRLQARWREADHEQRRQIVVTAALDLLRRHGLKAVTMRRVAHRLGIGAMTLYTYIRGQDELRQAMIREGFNMLAQGCRSASTLGSDQGWRGGARYYIQFALTYPSLYDLMFRTPLSTSDADQQIMRAGIQPLLDRVREQMILQGATGPDLEQKVRYAAGRFWVALHGLASLHAADRLGILDMSADELLDELLHSVSPT